MDDRDFEKLIEIGLDSMRKALAALSPEESYTLRDIIALAKLPSDMFWDDFCHIVLHAQPNIESYFMVNCTHCKQYSLRSTDKMPSPEVCPFCHHKSLEVIEYFRIRRPLIPVESKSGVKCAFCKRKVSRAVVGVEGKNICLDCIRKFSGKISYKEEVK